MVPARKLSSTDYYDGAAVPVQNPRRKTRKKRMPATIKICLLAVLFVVTCIFYLNQQVQTMYLSLKLAELEQQVKTAQQRNDHLRVNLESARSLQKIEYIARTELGMIDPDVSSSLVVNPSASPHQQAQGRWIEDTPEDEWGVFVALAGWLNKILPLGGVEAGTLRR